MGVWQIQEAKSKFSQVINMAVSGEPQEITKNGKSVAFIVSADIYKASQKPSFIEVLRNRPHKNIDLSIIRNTDVARDLEL